MIGVEVVDVTGVEVRDGVTLPEVPDPLLIAEVVLVYFRFGHSAESANSSDLIICIYTAAVCWGVGEECKVEGIQVEPSQKSEVRVKMLYASLCHTDIVVSKGYPIPLFPRVLGHEGVGVVESIGEEVNTEDFKQGDIVKPTFVSECQECENCLSGKSNLCLKYPFTLTGLMLDGTSRMSTVKGQKMLYHIFSYSTWSEYTVVNVNYLLKLHNWGAHRTTTLPLSHASFLSCGFSTGFGASWKEAKIERGSTVAVIGLGAIGLGAIEGARMQGASRIIGVDKNEMKREKGIAFGMTDFINPDNHQSEHDQDHDKSVSKLIKDSTYGMGVDYYFECTGVASVPLESKMVYPHTKCIHIIHGRYITNKKVFLVFIGLRSSLHTHKKSSQLGFNSIYILFILCCNLQGKGTTIVLGPSGVTPVQIDYLSLMSGRTLKGSVFGGLKAKTDLPILINKCMNMEMQLDELLTHEVPLVDINQAFELLKQPNCVKVLIKI
ncbi:CYP enzymes assisting alcohol dehydrogenase-like [Rosa rugosa]|uniref:CYP enzymes assisting alcohol dehydrogenase-like n=1 Tax=Rosa rugosa TaxID=74645 RepID=UPI002B405939|nr:CYP enzymes assisting alcohol dehydrogenase-like [Rosa rugosa]